jgi:hypothetical protein
VANYVLPIEAIVEIMKSLPNVVYLQARIQSLPGIMKGPCIAEIGVGKGVFQSCIIATPGGQILLKQEKAFQALRKMGDLEWQTLPPTTQPLSNSGQGQPQSPSQEQPRPRTNPSLVTYSNGSGVNYPNTGVNYPNTGVNYPNTGVNYPNTGHNYPNSGVNYSNSGVNYPNTGVGHHHNSLVPYSNSGGGGIPRRTNVDVQQKTFDGLSRKHKQVLYLIDGHKTSLDIARLLRASPQEIDHILLELEQQRLILR